MSNQIVMTAVQRDCVNVYSFECPYCRREMILHHDGGGKSQHRRVVVYHRETMSSDCMKKTWIEGQDELDAILEETNTRVVDVPHDDLDVKVAFTEDFTQDDVVQVMRQLHSPTAVTEAIPIPDSVKTMGDFFAEDGAMARQIANTVADKIFGIDCSRCGTPTKKPVDVGARKLCAECAALEY